MNFLKVQIFLLLSILIVSQSCSQDRQCTNYNNPACVVKGDIRTYNMARGRSISGLTSGQCGCYSNSDCSIRTPCTFTVSNNADPGICQCSANTDCNPLYFTSCSSGSCIVSCTTTSDCSGIRTPVCVTLTSNNVKSCGCVDNSECISSAYPICNVATQMCVPCVIDSDCALQGSLNKCVVGVCTSSSASSETVIVQQITTDNSSSLDLILTIFSLIVAIASLTISAYMISRVRLRRQTKKK
jgi:hypothetical protein